MPVNSIDKYVGARVKARRKSLAMTQATLGEKLDLTFQQVQKYERGSNRISASKLLVIAQTLDAPISFFFDGLEEEAAELPTTGFSENLDSENAITNDILTFASSKEGRDLNQAFSRIDDPDIRRQFVFMVQSIAKGQKIGKLRVF